MLQPVPAFKATLLSWVENSPPELSASGWSMRVRASEQSETNSNEAKNKIFQSATCSCFQGHPTPPAIVVGREPLHQRGSSVPHLVEYCKSERQRNQKQTQMKPKIKTPGRIFQKPSCSCFQGHPAVVVNVGRYLFPIWMLLDCSRSRCQKKTERN